MSRHFCRVIFLSVTAVLFLITPKAKAEWIKGSLLFSPESGIDSLNRFLIIRDQQDSTFLGWYVVPIGDINNDSRNDVLIGRSARANAYTDNKAFIYFGGPAMDGIPDDSLVFVQSLDARPMGDLNHDGFADFAFNTAEIDSQFFELFWGGPLLDNAPDFKVRAYTFLSAPQDFDNNGQLDIALASVNGGPTRIYSLQEPRDTIPEFVIPDFNSGSARNITSGDFNGDGYPDLALSDYFNIPETTFVKFYWGGPLFDTIADFEIHKPWTSFGEFMFPTGDFNGDGYGDIFIGGYGANDEPSGIFFGGPLLDTIMDLDLSMDAPGAHFPMTSGCVAGDVNHDGYPDVLLGYSNDNSGVYELWLYLGGPNPDAKVDVFIDEGALGFGAAFLGLRVFGVGDLTGDGIDDFAAYSNTNSGCCWYSEVNFFAGWESNPTDVPYEHEPTLPAGFKLKDNYPNPFNPNTTIEFELPYRSQAKIEILNLLGQQVRTLLDRNLSVGTYRVEWDGKNDHGKSVTSGTYFYRLTTDQYSETKKMVLVK